MLGKDPYCKYDDQDTIIASIVDGLREFIHAEPAVRLTLDTHLSNPERAILAIPFESDQDVILYNFAHLIYQSLMGYYISAASQTSHFGISNLLLEGSHNSLLRREMEKLIAHFQSRQDMAGRLLQNVGIVARHPVPKAGVTFLSETIRQGLDIHVGYRVFATGKKVNCSQIFILQAGQEIIEQVYYNLEQIIHHGFVTYDESGDKYLNITESLVFKDLEEILKRAKTKELTRNKILNNLQFDTISKQESDALDAPRIGDRLYDVLNHIQDKKLKEATNRSRDLYTASLVGTSNLLRDRLQFREKQPDPEPQIEMEAQTTPASAESIDTSPPNRRPGSPSRKFKRRGPADGDQSRRRKFQKVSLTTDELNAGKVEVPAPPQEQLRVPPRRARRITRITADNGTLTKR